MGRRRSASAMAWWWVRRWTATGCGLAGMRSRAKGIVVAGSEAGLVDLDPETVIESGRLGPGEMIGVDMAERKVYHNEDMMDAFDAKMTYATLVDHAPLGSRNPP